MTLNPLFVDVYEYDVKSPNWALVRNDRRFAGAILKASEGTYYNGNEWFKTNWPAVRNIAGYGQDWFRGAYHFLKFNQDGALQANYYLKVIEQAGGWDKGDLWPIVDVELGGEQNSNHHATPEEVIRCTTDFAQQVHEKTGRVCMLYGNGAMRDLRIKDKMGCAYLWCPRYTSTLPPFIYERAGWKTSELWGWQYCGDGTGFLEGYPTQSPLGRTDISVLTFPGGLEAMREALYPKPVKKLPPLPRVLKLDAPFMSGRDVYEAQEKLGMTPDGVFGPKTQQAVMAFQRANKLAPDGKVGIATWRALHAD